MKESIGTTLMTTALVSLMTNKSMLEELTNATKTATEIQAKDSRYI